MQTGFGVSVLSHCTKLQQKWGLNSYLKEQADMKCLETFVNKDNRGTSPTRYALEKERAPHSSVLAWRIPGMGEPGGLPSMGSHRVPHG